MEVSSHRRSKTPKKLKNTGCIKLLEPKSCSSEGTRAEVHTSPERRSRPERSIPVLIIKKYPNSASRGRPALCRRFLGKSQSNLMVSRPTLARASRRAGQVHNVWSELGPSIQVLNIRKPPNAVPGGLLFSTDPWVNSNHTLSPFCSSAIAKVVAVLPLLCSSVAQTGVRW